MSCIDYVKVNCLRSLLLVMCSCARHAPETNQAAPSLANKAAETQVAAAPSEVTDPTCCGLASNNCEGLAEAWRKFTEGGQFRLARADEMNFPESAKRERAADWKIVSRPFQYAWGRRGFDTDKDHLVAIVVDTSRNDPERFSLVIFSSVSGSNEYRPYWLYRNRDLSRTMIDTPSGYLMLTDYNEDGTRKGCDVFWNPKSSRYICRPMKG